MKKKTTIVLFVAIFSVIFNLKTNAQAQTGTAKHLKLFMTLSTDQTMSRPIGDVKVLSRGIYIPGAFGGIYSSTQNGQQASYNNIMFFPNNGLTPSMVGDGITFPAGSGFNSVTETSQTLWATGGKGLYTYDYGSGTWLPTTVQADTIMSSIEALDDTTVLLIGPMSTVNGIVVNGICTYSQSGGIVPFGSGFNTDDKPINVSRKGNIISIGGSAGLYIADTKARTLRELPNPGLGSYPGFITHGDTSYVTGQGTAGSCFMRRIGENPWELIGYGPAGLMGGMAEANDKIMLISRAIGYFTLANGTVLNGDCFAYDIPTGTICASPVTGFEDGASNVVYLPDGDYFGWSVGGNLFTTKNTTISAISAVSSDAKLSIYPNPATSFAIIDGLTDGQDITITNSIGQTILYTQATGSKFVFNTQNIGDRLLFVNRTNKLIIN